MIAEGRVIRVKPSEANVGDLPLLQGLPENRQESKLKAIHEGGELLDEFPPLPDERPCRDVVWVVLFLAAAVALFVYAAFNIEFFEQVLDAPRRLFDIDGTTIDDGNSVDGQPLKPSRLLSAAAASLVAALVTANLYLILAHRAPNCVVWSALILTPILFITSGVIWLLVAMQGDSPSPGHMVGGAAVLLAGVLQLVAVFCCWRRLIPFTVKLTEVVSDVISRNPCILVVPLFGAVVSAVWCVSCVLVMVGYMLKHDLISSKGGDQQITINGETVTITGSPNGTAADVDLNQEAAGFGILFLYFFVFVWGSQVAYNVTHMTTCGVLGRWYYRGLASDSDSSANESSSDDSEAQARQKVRNPIAPSLAAALTKSLGSNCLGSFIVAIIRALQALADSAEQDAASDGNIVCCLCMCCLRCVLQCIGDMMEYFNEWAYIQCAVRGTSFCQSARITLALMTCSNVKYIISDLLLDSVVNMGGLICGVVAAAVGAITEYALGGHADKVLIGALIGLFLGLPVGMSSLSTMSSAAKTILACWADDPEPLQATHPEIAEEFEARIRGGIAAGPKKRRGIFGSR